MLSLLLSLNDIIEDLVTEEEPFFNNFNSYRYIKNFTSCGVS